MLTKDHIILVLLGLLMTLSTIINVILILSLLLLRKEKLNIRKVTLLGLGTINLLTAASYHPILISFILQSSSSTSSALSRSESKVVESLSIDWRILCKILSGMERGIVVTTTWSITAASLDKYLSLFQQQHTTTTSALTSVSSALNRYKMRAKFSVLIVFSAWMIGVIFGAFSFVLTKHKYSNESHYCYLSLGFHRIYHLVFYAAFITLGFIIPSIVMILLYSYTTKQLFIHRTLLEKNPFKNCKNFKAKNSPLLTTKIKDSKLLVVNVILFLLTVTPYFIMNLILSTGHWSSMEFPDSVYIGLVLLLHTNCCISPLLCGFSNSRIRHVLLDTIKQRLIPLSISQQGDTSAEEISFITADCAPLTSDTDGNLSVRTSRTSIASQDPHHHHPNLTLTASPSQVDSSDT